MSQISRPDGALIYYEVAGSGYPVLLLGQGGAGSGVSAWARSAVNPLTELADEFTLIGMDQRHTGRSPAPALPFSYDQTVADQLAVLDAAGTRQAHVIGTGIGCVQAWRLIDDASDRITAAVCIEPAGLDATNGSGTFYRPFHEAMRLARAEGMAAVVRAALANPVFEENPDAGPFAPRIHADPAFREQVRAMTVESYVALLVRFRDGVWPDNPPYFTVSEEWMRRCPAPMLVLPGSDPFHPTGIAERICREAPAARCLDVDCREPAKLGATIEAIRAFLMEHVPA